MKYPALVGIVPRKNLWEIIKNEKWYHIPVSANSAPKKPESIKYIAFYFPEVFGEDGYKVIWYAEVLSFEIKKRISSAVVLTRYCLISSAVFLSNSVT